MERREPTRRLDGGYRSGAARDVGEVEVELIPVPVQRAQGAVAEDTDSLVAHAAQVAQGRPEFGKRVALLPRDPYCGRIDLCMK